MNSLKIRSKRKLLWSFAIGIPALFCIAYISSPYMRGAIRGYVTGFCEGFARGWSENQATNPGD